MWHEFLRRVVERRTRAQEFPDYSCLESIGDGSFLSILPSEDGDLDLQGGWHLRDFSHDRTVAAVQVRAYSESAVDQWVLEFDGVESVFVNRRGADDYLEGAGLGEAVSQLEVWAPVDACRHRWFRLVLRELDILLLASGIRLIWESGSLQKHLDVRKHREPPVWLDPGACRVCGNRNDAFYENGAPTYADCLRCLAESGVDDYSEAAVARYRKVWVERLGETGAS